jgi:diaminopimelate decarboxylase
MTPNPKPPYERPTLVRHEMGLMNKFSRVQSMRPRTEIAGVPITELIDAYGSPLFVFSEKTIVERYRELRDAFERRYPKVRIAWSYKTNYLDAICRVFHGEGAWAEVVSEFEWEKARRLGVPGDRIHFNGPYKPEAALERVLREGTIVHIDHFDEMLLAERVAEKLGVRPKVALRLNLAVGAVPQWSRFGFNLESGQARDAVNRLVSGGRLDLTGIHCHLGTFIAEADAYRDEARKLAEFANEVRERHGVRLAFIDIGGGFASHNTLKAQYLPGDQATPSFSAICGRRLRRAGGPRSPLRFAADARLGRRKSARGRRGLSWCRRSSPTRGLPDGRRGLVVDAGVNVLFTSFLVPARRGARSVFRGMAEPTVLYGPLCMNIDVVRETSCSSRRCEVGDRVVFENVGAYNVTQWMQFITYRPAVVLVGPDGRHARIRRAEDLQSVVGHEEAPPWQA